MFPTLSLSSQRQTTLRNAGFAAALLLAAVLPFELERPLLPLGPLVLTNVEVLLAAVLALALVAGPVDGGPRLPRLWSALGVWFIAAALLAALLTPESRANALKATLRTGEGLLLVLALLRLAPTARRGRWVAAALALGATAAVLLGLAEHVAGFDFPWLSVVRPMPTYAGPFLRLSGPFDYANQAAVFFEATLPLTFALTLEAAHAGRRALAAGGALAVLLQAQATLLTFSRAGFVTLLLVCAGVAVWLLLARNRRAGLAWAGLAALVAVVVAANWLLSPSFRLRLASDVDGEWYRTTMAVPAELTLAAGETRPVEITLTNRGALTWQNGGSQPFVLAARWQTVDGQGELTSSPQWSLPASVAPGESITLSVPLRAPARGGGYRLIWDMRHEGVNWFDARGDAVSSTQVIVTSGASAGADDPATAVTTPLSFDAPLPGRRVLWAIAAQLIVAHPLTGIGLDNYRLTYGRYLSDDPIPETDLDRTVHSNNWYLETLVSVGILGALPFFLWLATLLWAIIRGLRRPTIAPLQIAAGAGLLAFVIHGVLDYFLLFNATALLFWMLAALWVIFDSARAV
jgi:hypothetical protein